MKALAFAGALALAPAAVVAETQVEVHLGAGLGSTFTRRGPFVFDGVSFAGFYRTCPPEVDAATCAFAGATDLAFGLENRYSALGAVGVEARRGIGGPFLVGAGLLGGLALRSQRFVIGTTDQVVDGRPVLTDELADVANEHANFSTNGLGTLAYLHAGLRWDRGFESRTTVGYRASGTRVFVEAGGGWLAAVPGGGLAGLGHPPGIHVAGGLTLKRTNARSLTFSLRHVRALRERDEALLVDSRQSWTLFQVGWLMDR